MKEALAQQDPWCMKMNGCKTKCEDCPVEVVQQEPVAWMTISPFGDEDDIWYANPEGQLREGWTYKALYEEPPKQNPLTSIDYVPCCTDQTCPKCKAATPPQPEDRNFCPRCGKRTADLTVIHTCTPPQERT